MDRAMAQASSRAPIQGPSACAACSPAGVGSPVVVLVEQHDRLSNGFGHLFDYLGIRLERVRSSEELQMVISSDQPMAIIWELAADRLDSWQVLGKIAEHGPGLPILIVASEDPHALAVVDTVTQMLRLSEVRQLSSRPELQEIIKFLFQAGRKSGTFRVLSV
jgi:DNA-binding NtrC family response regulator